MYEAKEDEREWETKKKDTRETTEWKEREKTSRETIQKESMKTSLKREKRSK